MTALICGSLAFDSVMVFQGRFRDHILPDRIHLLNVSFLVPSLRRNFGGCAGNIAYNLALLGGAGAPMATVGHDFAPYANWLRVRSVDLAHVVEAYLAGLEPATVRLEVVAHRPHRLALLAEQLEVVGDVAGAAAEIAPHARHQERHVQHVDAVGEDVLAEMTGKDHDGVECQGAAD